MMTFSSVMLATKKMIFAMQLIKSEILEQDNKFLFLSNYSNRERNGTPLPYSCLENPMDGGAW